MAWVDLTTRAVGYKVTAANWNEIVGNFDLMQTWTNFTPTLEAVTTNPTLSDDASHTIVGHYRVVGDGTAGGKLHANIWIKFGTSGVAAGTGDYKIGGLPINIAIGNITGPDIGKGRLVDASAGTRKLVAAYASSATVVKLFTDAATNEVGAAVPWTWADSDEIFLHLEYRI